MIKEILIPLLERASNIAIVTEAAFIKAIAKKQRHNINIVESFIIVKLKRVLNTYKTSLSLLKNDSDKYIKFFISKEF